MSFDLFEEHARELAGTPAEWSVFLVRNIGPPGGLICTEATGAVAPAYRSGPRKGQPNFKARDRSTERTVYVKPEDHDAWCDAWELRTGKCQRCVGRGRLPWRFVKGQGAEYKPCPRCRGTGAATREAEGVNRGN